jgi:proteic killer suppression protein
MIKSFANQESEQIYHGIHTHAIRKDLSSYLVKVAQRKMDMLNCIDSFDHIPACFPATGEAGVRDAHEKHSIPIEGNWRIAFRWDKDHAFDVEVKS